MAVQKIGEHIPREEDFRLLRGKGRYVSDVKLPNEAQGVVLRSPHAHARILSIDTGPAQASPGIIAVFTAADLAKRGLGSSRPFAPRKRSNGTPAFVCPQPLLVKDRVRYVGDPVAFIVAESVNAAKDAAELVDISYEPLPAVITAEAALAPGAPAVHDENPGNEAFFHEQGDKAAVETAFAKATHVVRHKTVINRVTANTMEPRGCVAQYDPVDGRYTIRCTVQSAHGPKAILADQIFKLPHTKFRVLCDNMGGGFGMKGGCYPEYALSLFAAEATGRPVRWIAERSEGILADDQSRGSVVDTELALDKDGKFLALRMRNSASIGAYYSNDRPAIPLTVALNCLINTYHMPAVHAQVKAILTNTMTIAP
jgi:carbon-monoxide dehydrogenase large subunit